MDPLLHITVLAYLQIMMTQTSSEIRFPKAFNIYFLSKLISLQTADQLQLPPGSQRPDRGPGEAPGRRPGPISGRAPLGSQTSDVVNKITAGSFRQFSPPRGPSAGPGAVDETIRDEEQVAGKGSGLPGTAR